MKQADEGAAARGGALLHASDSELARMMASEHGEDDAAWREFWARYSDQLMRYIGAKARWLTRPDCEDVLMETVGVKMPQRIANFVAPADADRPLFAWARTIAWRLILDRARQAKKDAAFSSEYLRLLEAANEFEIAVPDEASSDTDADSLLERALTMLVKRDQAVLELGRAGFSDRQIAERLRIHAGLVRKVRYKALQRLETILTRLHSAQPSAPT